MHLAQVQPRRNKPQPKLHSKSVLAPDISESLLLFRETHDSDLKNALARDIIKLCYGSKPNQLYLCNIMGVPCSPGPIAISSIPLKLSGRAKELPALFRYLQRVKQSFACWIIFFDKELGILNVKLLTKFQFEQFEGGLDLEEVLLGVFVGRNIQKQRVKSTIEHTSDEKKFNLTTGLSTKATNDSFHSRHNNKKIKSISMKDPKPTKTHSMANLYTKQLQSLSRKEKAEKLPTKERQQAKTKKCAKPKASPFLKKTKIH